MMRLGRVFLGFALIFLVASSASAATVYCTGSGNTLITVDTVTGAATTIGPFGFGDTYAAAFTPDGTLWTIVNGFSNGQLATVDTGTGAATPVGTPMGTADVIALEADAAGTLYAAGFNGNFYTVNTTTGQLTLVGNLGFGNLMDMAFDNSGTLWATPGATLYTIDTATGVGTFVCSLTGTVGGEMGLMVDPATDIMYVTTFTNPAFIYEVDLGTCTATQIGTGLGVPFPHGGDIFGAAAAAAAIPALDDLGIVIFIALLAIVAVFALRGYLQ